jgi:hypothetical protein
VTESTFVCASASAQTKNNTGKSQAAEKDHAVMIADPRYL